jgi:hypothetical protein
MKFSIWKFYKSKIRVNSVIWTRAPELHLAWSAALRSGIEPSLVAAIFSRVIARIEFDNWPSLQHVAPSQSLRIRSKMQFGAYCSSAVGPVATAKIHSH